MSKFRVFVIFMVMVMVLQLAACAPAAQPAAEEAVPAQAEEEAAGAPAQAEEAEPEVAEAAEAGPKQYDPIVVACWSSPEHDNLVKVAAEYEKETGNKVIVEEIARESYYDKLTTTFIGGGADYDVAYVMSDWIPGWVKAEALHEISSYTEDPNIAMEGLNLTDFGKSLEYFTFDGQLYVLPSEGDTAWLFYRKDLFEEKGLKVPETWDEYLEAAIALNNPPEIYGTVTGAKQDEAWWDFMYYLYGMGGDLLDENYQPIINNEAGVKALSFYAGLLQEYGVVSPDVTTYGYNEILTSLQEGKSAMGIEWMAATQTLLSCEESPKVCKDGEPLLGYVQTPGYIAEDGTLVRSTGGSQWGWAVPAGSENPEAGYKFIEWLTSKEGAKMWALNGGIPGNIEALKDAEVVEQIPQFAILAEVMPYRSIFPALTVSPEMLPIVNEGVVAAVAGIKTPQEAADEMADKLTEILKSGMYIE